MPIDINALKKLDFIKQAAFAYLTCERLYPNYVYFSNNFGFGSPNVLREAIDFLYLNIFEKKPDESKINLFSKEVEKNTPDTEDFDTVFVSSALDACTAIIDSLSFLIDRNFTKIQQISAYATDTVDLYIYHKESLDFNNDQQCQQKINNHALMQREIMIQSGIISFLTKRHSLDSDDLQTLLRLQENNKKSNIDL